MDKKGIGLAIRQGLNYYLREIGQTCYHFMKWTLLSIFVGAVVGSISSGFAHVLGTVALWRKTFPWLLYLLPLAGVLIIFLYKKFGSTSL